MSVTWNGRAVMARILEGAADGVEIAAQTVLEEGGRLILSPPKSGRIYTTRFFTIGRGPGRKVIPYGSRPAHQASAPGQPPANDTGALVASGRVESNRLAASAKALWDSPVASWMELGTDRIEPRPFARRALLSKTTDIALSIARSIRTRL